MEKKSIRSNYMYNMFYQILTIIIPLITTPYLSRTLGTENIGIFSYTLSIVSYFIMLSVLGTSLYGQREIAYQCDNANERSQIFYEIQFIKMLSLIITSFIYIIFLCIDNKYDIYYRIMIVELLSNFLDISWFFQGIENFKSIVLKNSFIKLVSLISIFIFVKTKNDLFLYFMIYVLANLFGNLSMWLNLKKYIVKRAYKLNIKKHIFPIFSLLLPQMAMKIYKVLDKTMIGIMTTNMSEVGFYEQSQKIILLATTVISAYSTVVYSKMAYNYSQKNKDELKRTMSDSVMFILFLSIPITFGICGIASDFVPWFFGNEYLKVIDLLIFSSPIVIFVSITNLIGNRYLIITGREKLFTKTVVIGSIINVIVNYLLIPKYLSVGAVIGSIFAEGIVLVLQFSFIRNEIDMKRIYINTIKYFLSSIIMLLIILFINNLLNPSIISSIIEVIAGFLVYIIMLILLKEDYIINNLYNELKKQFKFESH